MTPQQALQLIDNVLASVSGTRADHAKLQEAVKVLGEAIAQKQTK